MTTDPDPTDDHRLLAAHCNGDADAFGILFSRHRDRLWAVALRTTGDREDAADALQDAMISVFRHADRFRGDARVSTWLHRIVVNACLDRLRRNKTRTAGRLDDDFEEYAERDIDVPAGADPEVEVLAAERRQMVLSALSRLPVEQRAALVLVDMEGYPVAEAARILGCPAGTVKSRCARGRTKLARVLRSSALSGTTSAADTSDHQTDPGSVTPRSSPLTGGV